ncbi:MAG: TonB-dependent receptor [Deltaproteobacteria bacterium]|nr:TonB-dependent receptor [Deltaproteobacteria bacterium]
MFGRTRLSRMCALLPAATLLVLACPALAQPGPDGDGAGEPSPAYGAPHDAEAAAETTDPIVVAPRRSGQPRFEAPASVERVDGRRGREMGARTAPEMLEESTGVAVQATNRGAGAPILRGLIGPSNLLVVDGLRYHQSTWRTGPNQYLATLDPSTFGAIEVVLGPASVTYGSGAMGGVLAVVPLQLPKGDGYGAQASLRLSSADLATEAWGQASYRKGALGVTLGGGYRRFGELRTGGGETAPISDFGQVGYTLRLGYDLGKRTELRVSWLGSRIDDAGRADQIDKADMRWYDNADDMGWIELRHRGTGMLDSVRVAASMHRSDETVDRLRCKVSDITAERASCIEAGRAMHDDESVAPSGPLQRQNQNQDTVLTLGGLLQASLKPLAGARRDDLLLDVGGELWSDGVGVSTARERRTDKDDWTWADASRGNFSEGSRWTELGAFARAEYKLTKIGGGTLWLDAGGRFAHFRAHAGDVPGLGDIDYVASGAVGSGALRLLMPTWMAYASFAQGFRAPNLQETTTLGDTGSTFEVPNADLGPERSNSVELGARTRLARLELHGALWYSQLTDAIDSREVPASEFGDFGIDAGAIGSKPVRQRINAAGATLFGAQLAGTLRLGALSPWARLAWMQGDVEQDDGSTVPYRRIPALSGAAGLRWEQGDLRIEAFTRFAATQDRLHPSDESDLRICADPDAPGKTYKDGGASCPGTPGWADVGLRAGYRFSRNLRLDAVARNLLDQNYRVHGSGFDAPGIGGSLAVSGRF